MTVLVVRILANGYAAHQWVLYDDTKYWDQQQLCRSRNYATPEEAEAAAREVFGAGVDLECGGQRWRLR